MKQYLEVDRLASGVDGWSLGSIHALISSSRFSGSFIPNGEGDLIWVDPGETSRLSGSKLIFLEFISLDDLKSHFLNAMIGSHFRVQSIESLSQGDGSELLVRVVPADVGSVFEVDTVVLGGVVLVFKDFLDLQDSSVGLLKLVSGSVDHPELGFGEDLVLSIDSRDNESWVRF